jgi:mannose-6-phosphate isomerase-like protein (cupin superfamily)
MATEIVHLAADNLLFEYGLHTQRLMPWAVLNAPFEGSWALAKPHTESTLHSHHEHEIFIAVRGSAIVECDGKQAEFRAGDVAFFQPGLEHRVLNDNDEEFMFYSVWWDEDMAERFVTRNREEGQA